MRLRAGIAFFLCSSAAWSACGSDDSESEPPVSDSGADASADVATLPDASSESSLPDASPNGPEGCSIVVIGGSSGMAPFTLHVSGLDPACNLKAGTPESARYTWDFGDGSSPFVGWSTAHVYDVPGEYTVTLAIQNEAGDASILTTAVSIAADTRGRIHVSPSGNDANDGATEATAVQTLGRVAALLAPDTAVLFEAGQSFGPGSLALAHPNVRLSTYGGSERAEITSDGGTIFPIGADRVTIENLHLSSTADPPPTGVSVPHDDYATIRSCRFDGLGYAVTNGGIDADAKGVLLLDNAAGVLSDYLWWGEGSHHTLRGNTLENSVNEHGIRFYADHVSVYDNAITNDSKTTISAASAEWVYVARNTFASGRVRIGYFTGSEFTSVEHAVFERNVVLDPDPGGAPVEIFPARDVFVRNNVVRTSDLAAFLIWADGGGDPFPVTAAERIRLVNNTVVNQGQYGAFVRIAGQAAGPGSIVVANNLHVFPNMIGGQYGPPFNVRIEAGGTLGGAVFSHDSWQTPPAPIGSCDAVHMVEGLGCGDHFDVVAWDALDETDGESYHQELLDADHAPPPGSPPTTHGAPFPGVFDDLYGSLRPTSAPWAAGAVE